jgi:hypothetical protein
MTLWPALAGPPLPRYLVEFLDGSFNAQVDATWLCVARCPTEAVVLVLREVFEKEEVQPTSDVRYQVWLATPEEGKGFELTGAVDIRTVEDYLVMHRGVEDAPPKAYTVMLACPDVLDKDPYWITLQARTPTEAFLIAYESSRRFLLRIKCLFSIYEGWNSPQPASTIRDLYRIPSIHMHGAEMPPKPRGPKVRKPDTTPIHIDWEACSAPEESPWTGDSYTQVAWLSGTHADVAREVNVKLLSYLLDPEHDGRIGMVSKHERLEELECEHLK